MRESSARQISIQFAVPRRGVPSAVSLRRWVIATLPQTDRKSQAAIALTIRVVGSGESRQLNRKWRHKDKPTNVLSFPYSEPQAPGPKPRALLAGDLIVCAPVVAREAREQRKPLAAHWAHMVVHGALHLQGYDHVKNRDAKRMETREVEILAQFGYQDPYVFPEGGPKPRI